MKFLVILFAFMAVTSAVSDTEWSTWKTTMSKTYPDATSEQRARANYDANDKIIKANNALYATGGVSFQMGHNRFSDLSSADFEALLQDTIPTQTSSLDAVPFPSVPSGWTPSQIDLRQSTKIPVQDQGSKCAAGWAFAGTAMLEYWLLLRGWYSSIDMSEQNAVDCARTNGCKGGWVEDVFGYFIQNGINWASKYPSGYTGTDNNCRYIDTIQNTDSGVQYYNSPKDFYYVDGHDESIAYALHEFGWVSVCLDARKWQFYKSGVMKAKDCGEIDNQKPNHCVTIVGYGVQNGAKYWTIRNSWSTKWGDNGFMYLERGANSCGILEKYSSRICTY